MGNGHGRLGYTHTGIAAVKDYLDSQHTWTGQGAGQDMSDGAQTPVSKPFG
jgi:hypothetical protein